MEAHRGIHEGAHLQIAFDEAGLDRDAGQRRHLEHPIERDLVEDAREGKERLTFPKLQRQAGRMAAVSDGGLLDLQSMGTSYEVHGEPRAGGDREISLQRDVTTLFPPQ